MKFRIQDQKPVTVTQSDSDPLQLARLNREYPVSFAGQFTRHRPFLLIFVIHPARMHRASAALAASLATRLRLTPSTRLDRRMPHDGELPVG